MSKPAPKWVPRKLVPLKTSIRILSIKLSLWLKRRRSQRRSSITTRLEKKFRRWSLSTQNRKHRAGTKILPAKIKSLELTNNNEVRVENLPSKLLTWQTLMMKVLMCTSTNQRSRIVLVSAPLSSSGYTNSNSRTIRLTRCMTTML